MSESEEPIQPETPETLPAPTPEPTPELELELEPVQAEPKDAKVEMARMSRRSFMWAAGAVAGAYGVFRWIDSMEKIGDQPWLFRRTFETNEAIAQKVADTHRMARTYTKADITPGDKVNGDDGLAEVSIEDWRLKVEGPGINHVLTMDDILKLPAFELITEFNCIEGWSRIMHWKGIRFADLLKKLNIDTAKLPTYVGMETPMRGYYVGHHLESVLHPQSLLAYELNGEPLSDGHGAPLRHVLPIKYGYKQIKHVGLIRFTDKRPDDYWAELGYDWYGTF